MPSIADIKPVHFGWSVSGKVATITLNRPEKKNPLTFESYAELRDLFRTLNYVKEVKTVVVTGAGGNFCSGADLKEMAGGHQAEPLPDGLDVQARLAADADLPWKSLLRTWRPAVPLIAAVEGTAIAGGTELLGATEIRVAGKSARFGISEVRWSLYPMGGSAVRIPRQVPYTVACELLLTGEHITAQRALELGLIGHVVPDGQALAKAKEIGHVIGDYSAPLAVKALLRTLRETNGMEESEALAHEFTYGWDVFASEDAKEGPRAFKEKRKPNFLGK